MTVDEIIEKCGGVRQIAARIGKTESAVAKWRGIGIRDHYWPALIDMAGGAIQPGDIYAANLGAREPPAPAQQDGAAA